MTGKRVLMDPTSERSTVHRDRQPRPKSLNGLTIGLLDISKAKGDIFLDRIESLLIQKGCVIRRFKKPTFARTAPVELMQDITSQCDAVIEALAD